MKNSHSRPTKWLTSQLLNKNIFKHSVTLTHKGDKNVINYIGGLLTIVILILLLLYGLVLGKRMIDKSDIQWNQNTEKESNFLRKYKEVELTDFDDIELKVSYIVHNPAITMEEMKRIGTIEMYYLDFIRDDEGITTNASATKINSAN